MRKRTRSYSTVDALLPAMLSCFNVRSPPPSSPPLRPLALKRRLVSVRPQPEGVLRLETGHVTRAGSSLRRTDSRGAYGRARGNQDALAVVVALPVGDKAASVFGVFDGHGRSGGAAAEVIAEALVREVARALALVERDPVADLPQALRRSCSRADAALRVAAAARPALDLAMSGTTATLCVIRDNELTCANVGDSRIMLGSQREAPIALTHDHVPMRPDERERIESAGGRVEQWSPYAGADLGPPRVYLRSARVPGLAVTRAFGDTVLDGIISCRPDITRIHVQRQHSFVVLASDGIWAIMEMDAVNRFVARRRTLPAQLVADALVDHAVECWRVAGEDSVDDISVVLVYLQW